MLDGHGRSAGRPAVSPNTFFLVQDLWEKLPDRLIVGSSVGTACQAVDGHLLVIGGHEHAVELSG